MLEEAGEGYELMVMRNLRSSIRLGKKAGQQEASVIKSRKADVEPGRANRV